MCTDSSEAVVVSLKSESGSGQVQGVSGGGGPWQIQQCLQVVPRPQR